MSSASDKYLIVIVINPEVFILIDIPEERRDSSVSQIYWDYKVESPSIVCFSFFAMIFSWFPK